MHLARGRLSFDLRGFASEEESPGASASARPRPARRVDHRAQLGPEPLARPRVPHARLARPADAGAPGGAGAHRRPRDVGELGRARRRGHRSPTPRSGRRHHRPRRQGRADRTADRHRPGSVQACVPRPSDEQFDRAVRECIDDCLASGLTGIHEMGAELYALAAYRRLIERGEFPFRNYVAVARPLGLDLVALPRAGAGDLRRGRAVNIGAVKLMADGALGSRGAALHDAYCDDPGNTGPGAGAGRGDRGRHARGRGAGLPGLRARHRRPGQSPRAGRLRAGARPRASPGPSAARGARADPDRRRHPALPPPGRAAEHAGHALHLGHGVGRRPAGPDRLRGAYAWRSLLATGVGIAGGSDFPVESPNPFHGLHAAVTRRPRSGEDPHWQPEQRMTRDEAVRSFTSGTPSRPVRRRPGLARAGQARGPHGAFGRRVQVPGGAHRRDPSRADRWSAATSSTPPSSWGPRYGPPIVMSGGPLTPQDEMR